MVFCLLGYTHSWLASVQHVLLWYDYRRLDFAQAAFTRPPWNASTHSEYSYYVNTEWQPPRRSLRTLQLGALRAVLWSAAVITLAAMLLTGRNHARGEGHYAGQASTP